MYTINAKTLELMCHVFANVNTLQQISHDFKERPIHSKKRLKSAVVKVFQSITKGFNYIPQYDFFF